MHDIYASYTFLVTSEYFTSHFNNYFKIAIYSFYYTLVTAASSNDDGVGKTKLNFKYVMESDGKKQNVIMQLSPQEFYKLLHELDRAKGNLQSLTGGSTSSS